MFSLHLMHFDMTSQMNKTECNDFKVNLANSQMWNENATRVQFELAIGGATVTTSLLVTLAVTMPKARM